MQQPESTLLYNAVIINEGHRTNGWILLDGDTIAAIGEGAPGADVLTSASQAEDLHGAWIFPGVIDDQVHFREPGLTHKADIASESRAAVAGGVTSFMDMPNTLPQTVTAEALEEKYAIAARSSAANYAFFPGATNGNAAWLRSLDFTRVPGVKVFLGASTGNMLVDSEEALDSIFSLPCLIAIHSEDESIIRHNADDVRARYGDDAPVELHPQIRSHKACVRSTKSAIERARRLGTRLHVLHLSTAEEAAMFEAGIPLEEKRITAEVCVHHLWFTDADYAALGTRIKWNPAIKTAADREALRAALRTGAIDVVATDHAPHLLSEKQGGCLKAASGGPMVQFSLPLMLELAHEGVFTPEEVAEYMCHRPARLFSIKERGFLRPGYKADLAIVLPEGETHIDRETIQSKCGWSPLEGVTLSARVAATYVNGARVYPFAADGSVPAAARPLQFSPRR